MLRVCILDYTGSLNHNLPLVEFVYDYSYCTHNTDVTPFTHCMISIYRTPMCWDGVRRENHQMWSQLIKMQRWSKPIEKGFKLLKVNQRAT